MSDQPRIKVRPVRGRVVDPFRGSADENQPERFEPRTVDTQPFDEVLATIERLPAIRVTRAGRRITFGRDHEVAKVSFASAGRFVSLDDATFEGDGLLVIQLLHALLPLFGAVEVRIGKYSELIDGHEPFDVIQKRYESWWVEESLKLAEKLGEPKFAPAADLEPPAKPLSRKTRRKYAIAFAAILAVLFGVIIYVNTRPEPVGEACTTNSDCETNRCLQRDDFGGAVCTQSCGIDSDCPHTMRCGRNVCVPFWWK